MRLFIAIPLPSSFAKSLHAQTQLLASRAPRLRWLEPESWHLTLQFLGSVAPDRAEPLTNGLSKAGGAPIPMQLSHLECFERAGALVVMIQPSSQLNALQCRVHLVTQEQGFASEARPFTPHITLARWKGSLPRTASAALNQTRIAAEFVADRYALFQSFTESSGARYEILRSYPLA